MRSSECASQRASMAHSCAMCSCQVEELCPCCDSRVLVEVRLSLERAQTGMTFQLIAAPPVVPPLMLWSSTTTPPSRPPGRPRSRTPPSRGLNPPSSLTPPGAPPGAQPWVAVSTTPTTLEAVAPPLVAAPRTPPSQPPRRPRSPAPPRRGLNPPSPSAPPGAIPILVAPTTQATLEAAAPLAVVASRTPPSQPQRSEARSEHALAFVAAATVVMTSPGSQARGARFDRTHSAHCFVERSRVGARFEGVRICSVSSAPQLPF